MSDSILADAVKSAWSGLTFPGDVLAGKADPYDVERAIDFSGLAALSDLPVKSIHYVGKRGGAKLASRTANIYNPPVKEARPFGADYPTGGAVNEAGLLRSDVDGLPLVARYVVGRQVAGQPDVALPHGALDEIAAARTGEAIRKASPRSAEIGNDVGRTVFRRSGEPDYVAVSRALTDSQYQRVAAHEIAHVIDKAADDIPVSGLNDELRTIYNDLNNPQGHGKKFGPEQNRYRGGDVQRELIAEAIRAYLSDPNYIKTVAPKTAARIRQFVNDNPKLREIIQFNSFALPLVTGGGALGLGRAFDETYAEGNAT